MQHLLNVLSSPGSFYIEIGESHQYFSSFTRGDTLTHHMHMLHMHICMYECYTCTHTTHRCSIEPFIHVRWYMLQQCCLAVDVWGCPHCYHLCVVCRRTTWVACQTKIWLPTSTNLRWSGSTIGGWTTPITCRYSTLFHCPVGENTMSSVHWVQFLEPFLIFSNWSNWKRRGNITK